MEELDTLERSRLYARQKEVLGPIVASVRALSARLEALEDADDSDETDSLPPPEAAAPPEPDIGAFSVEEAPPPPSEGVHRRLAAKDRILRKALSKKETHPQNAARARRIARAGNTQSRGEADPGVGGAIREHVAREGAPPSFKINLFV